MQCMPCNRQGLVKGHSQVYWDTVIFEDLAIPGDIELFLHGVVVQMKGAHLCSPRVGIQTSVSVIGS